MWINKVKFCTLEALKINLNKKSILFNNDHSGRKKSFSFPCFSILFLAFFFSFQSTIINAQFIDNKNGQAFTDLPFFNASTLQRYRVKSISGNFIHYKLGDRLRKTDYFRKYMFNRDGQLIEQLEFSLMNYKNDTSSIKYKYGNQGNVIQSVYSDNNGAYGYFYKYDEENRLINLEYRSKYGSKQTGNNFDLDERSIVYSEKSTYKSYPKQLHETVYNTHDVPYKDVFTYYDENNLVIRKTERLRRTRETMTTSYSYNQKHLIDTIEITSNRDGVQEREYVFSYDINWDLTEKKEFKNGELITKYAVLYDDKRRIINDFLIQDVTTNFIRDLFLNDYQYFDR